MLEHEPGKFDSLDIPAEISQFSLLSKQTLELKKEQLNAYQKVKDEEPSAFDGQIYEICYIPVFGLSFFMSPLTTKLIFNVDNFWTILGSMLISFFITGGIYCFLGKFLQGNNKKKRRQYAHMLDNPTALSTTPAIRQLHEMNQRLTESNQALLNTAQDKTFQFEVINWLEFIESHAINMYGEDFFDTVSAPSVLREQLVKLFATPEITPKNLESIKNVMVQVGDMKNTLSLCLALEQAKHEENNHIEEFEKALLNYQTLNKSLYTPANPISQIVHRVN